jgi:hypothetical protein
MIHTDMDLLYTPPPPRTSISTVPVGARITGTFFCIMCTGISTDTLNKINCMKHLYLCACTSSNFYFIDHSVYRYKHTIFPLLYSLINRFPVSICIRQQGQYKTNVFRGEHLFLLCMHFPRVSNYSERTHMHLEEVLVTLISSL